MAKLEKSERIPTVKLGVIAFSSKSGLGYQSKSYVKHLNPVKVLHIDISSLNGLKTHPEWYPNAITTNGIPKRPEIIEFLTGLDVVLMAETPLNYELYDLAKKMGVKTANVINWEFFDHIIYPELGIPDLIIMPSMWHFEEAEAFAREKGIKCVYIHHPVDLEEIPFRLRTQGKPYHIAGKPASHDRNGTMTFMQAVPDGRVATQSQDLAHRLRKIYRHSNVFTNIENQSELYTLGDILVFPRKYGGNCLPLNEALASGCPVIMPDVSPNNQLLPNQWLVPARTTEHFTPRTRVDIYEVNPDDIRQAIKNIRENIEDESETAYEIAKTISWEALKPVFTKELEALCE